MISGLKDKPKKKIDIDINNSPRFPWKCQNLWMSSNAPFSLPTSVFPPNPPNPTHRPPTLSCTFRNFHATFDRVIKVWLSQTPRILPTVSQALRRCICCKYHTLKQIGTLFMLGMFKMDICLESSKLNIFLEVRQKWLSQQLSNLAKEKKKQYLKTYIIHIIHRQSINSEQLSMFCWNK